MWNFEEWELFWKMLNSMPEFRNGEKPIAEPEVFRGFSNGARTDVKMAESYDADMVEMMAEKSNRTQKYLRTHYVRSDGNPVRKDKRKAYFKEKCRTYDPWHGWGTVRKYRQDEAEKADARDYLLEAEAIAEEAYWKAVAEEQAKMEAEAHERWIREQESRRMAEWLKYA